MSCHNALVERNECITKKKKHKSLVLGKKKKLFAVLFNKNECV